MDHLRNKTNKNPSKLTFQSYDNNNKDDKSATQEFYLNSISNISFNFAHSLLKGYYFTNKEIDFKFHENTIELFRSSLYQYSFFLIFFIFLILLYNIFDIISNKEAFDLINSIIYVVICAAIKFSLAIVICLILVFTYRFIKDHSLNNVHETIDSADNNNVCLGTCIGNSSYNIITSSNLNTLTTESQSKKIMSFIVKLRIIYFIIIILNLIMINISYITMNHINIKNIEISKDLYSNYTNIEENRKLFESKKKNYADFRYFNFSDNRNNTTSLFKEAYSKRNLRKLDSTITEDSLLISTFNVINTTSFSNDTQMILEYFRDNIITKQAILNKFDSKNFLFIVLNYISYYCFIYHCNTILMIIYSHNLITCLIYDIKLDKDFASVIQMQLLLLLFFLFTYYLKQNQMKTLVFDFISSRKTKVLKEYLFCFFNENENEILSINYNSNKQSSERLGTKNEEFLVSTNSKFDSSFKIKFNEKNHNVDKSSSDSKDSNNNDNESGNPRNNLNVNLKRNVCNVNTTENAFIFQEKENENLKSTNIGGMISMNNTEKDFLNSNNVDNEKSNDSSTNPEFNTKKISDFFSSFKQIDSNNIGNKSNSLILKDIINLQTLFNLRLNTSKKANNGSNRRNIKANNIYCQQEFDLTDMNKTNSEYCFLGEFEYNPSSSCNNSKDSNIQYFQVTLHKFYYNKIVLNVNITFKAITSQINFHIQNLKLKQKSKNFSKSVHEFKTPLITITSQLDTLNEKILNQNDLEEIMETAVSIKHLSHYMNFLILDIIEANISSNTNENNNDSNNKDKLTKPTIEIENINAIKQDIILFNYLILNSLLNYSNYSKNIESKLLYDDDLDFFFFNTNKTKFSQILLNIISNSVKFTKSGTIMISCFLEKNKSIFLTEEDTLFKQKRLSKGFIFGDRKEVFINKFIEDPNNTNNDAISLNNDEIEYDNKEIAYLKIIDTGKGMSPEYLEALSQGNPEIFKSNDISNSMGSGLGMNIVKNICSIMNYELSVYSENEIGTVYTIKFIVDKIDAHKNENNNSNNCSIRKTSNIKIPTSKLSNSTSRNNDNASFNKIDKVTCIEEMSSKYNTNTINLNNTNNLRNPSHVNDNISQKVSSDSNFSIVTTNHRKYDSTNLKKRSSNTNKITNYYYQNANNKNFKYLDLYLNMTSSNNLSSGSNTSYLVDNNSFYNSNNNNNVSSKFNNRGLSHSLGFKNSKNFLNSGKSKLIYHYNYNFPYISLGNINTNLKVKEKSLFNSNKDDIKDNIDNSSSTIINNSNIYDILKAKESNNSNKSAFSNLSSNNVFKSILRKSNKRTGKISIREINTNANNKFFRNRNNKEKPNNSFFVRKSNRCLTAIVKRQKIIQKLYNKINNNNIIPEYLSNINVNSDKNNSSIYKNNADIESVNDERFHTFNLTKKRHSINSFLPNINIKYDKPRKKTTSNSISMYFNNQASFNKRLMHINSNINNTLINSYKSIYSNNVDSKKQHLKSNFIENVMCSNRSNFSNPFNINFNKKESDNISLSKNDKTHSELNVNIISCKEIGDNLSKILLIM